MKRNVSWKLLVMALGLASVLILTGCPTETEAEAPVLTGTVRITGNPWIGQTLTADTVGLGGSGDISFQWQRTNNVGGGNWININGATSDTYVVESGDLNRSIRVNVTRANNSGSVTSASIGITSAPSLTGTVNIAGNPWVGHTLTANTDNLGGSGNIFFQWQRTNVGGGNWLDISGATSDTYVVESGDLNRSIRVTVTRANNSGSIASTSRDITYAPSLTGTVSITGNPWVGQTLTASTAGLGGSGDISFQWQRRDTVGNWINISDATNSTYVVQSSDLNLYVRVNVTRANNSGSVTSASIGIASGPNLTGTVSITGNPWVGHTLTANTDNLGGSGNIFFQWQRTNVGGGNWLDISGATSDTYVVESGDLNRSIRVTVTRANNSGIVSSPATAVVLDPVREFTISFEAGIDTQIAGPSVSVTAPPQTVTILNPEQFEFIRWFMGGTQITGVVVSGGNGHILTLNPSIHGNRVGIHRVTVEVSRSGVRHSKVIVFSVTP